jgi:monofunctional biosynthetic peptidoglycan transglycosylase
MQRVYLGNENFRAEAAAESYFHKRARSLTPIEAARLAAILPDPDVWSAARPGPYVTSRAKTIVALSAQVARDGLDVCVR